MIDRPAPALFDRTIKGRRWLTVLLLISLGMVLIGLQLPAVTISSFWLYKTDVSIMDGIRSFFAEGQTALGLLVLAVSVVFPVGKILLGLLLLARGRPRLGGPSALLAVLVWLSKWSMTDVFVFALIVLVLNGQLLTSADIHGGVALFAGGVLLSAFGISQVRRRLVVAA
ncbi:MAG: paraquat-inducible protein A [Parvibaculaceae bacterium]